MLQKSKKLLRQNKNILENFSFLSLLQAINILFPLLTYKYFIEVLGSELWGLIIFAQSIAMYFSVLINFGFDKSASKLIAVNRESKSKVSEILSSVLIIKACLFVIAFLLLTGMLFLTNIGRDKNLLYILSFGICFNEFLFPQWYFQGKEKLKFPVIINGITKISFLILMIFIVKSPEEYLMVPILNGLGAFLGGLFALYIVFKKQGEIFRFQKLKTMLDYLKESLPLFGSNIIISVKDRLSIIIIGSFLGMSEVAFYDLALKIMNFVNQPANIVNNAIYPKVSVDKNMKFVRKISLLTFSVITVLVVVLVILAPFIVELLSGGINEVAILTTRILLISPLIFVFSIFLAVNCLIVFGKYGLLLKGMIWTTLFYLILILIGYLFGLLNSVLAFAIITVLVYLFELGYRYYVSKKNKLI